MNKMTGKMFAMLVKVKAQMLHARATYGVPKSKSPKRDSGTNVRYAYCSGAQEIARRRSQIQRGFIKATK